MILTTTATTMTIFADFDKATQAMDCIDEDDDDGDGDGDDDDVCRLPKGHAGDEVCR